jgi:serine/threonine protein kinase
LLLGKSLNECIQEKQHPEFAELATLATSLFNAISELSDLGIIQRDIKPANVMVTGDKSRPFVLLDLGIAFQRGGTLITRESISVPGTLYYLAPEMLEANFRSNLDSRADIYTAALTVYEYATGINPFAVGHDSEFDTLYRIKKQPAPRLKESRADLPSVFCDILDQCLKKIPALRPGNPRILAKRIMDAK